ncbi:hypothetical protein [Chinese giant salamander iridovirus]|uniref:Uncharacterized protein n=1 Tax=Chinese giant salamander iridovirus TaxID=1213990 RepID=V5N035_FRG3V|nr:hypothetical protein [Chinese giant salamander iridovirus]
MRIFGASSLIRMIPLKIVSVDVWVMHLLLLCDKWRRNKEAEAVLTPASSLSGVKAGEMILTDLLCSCLFRWPSLSAENSGLLGFLTPITLFGSLV